MERLPAESRLRKRAVAAPNKETMRLLTHNMLRCTRKDVENGYPLAIQPAKIEIRESPCNATFIASVLQTLDWPAVCQAATQLGLGALPTELTDELVQDEAFLAALHHILMDVHVTEGMLVCPESGHQFPIANGTPNMILPEELVGHL